MYSQLIMIPPEAFQIPLETELNVRIIYDEIENCDDVKTLKENLRALVTQNSKLQHLLNTILEAQLKTEWEKLQKKPT